MLLKSLNKLPSFYPVSACVVVLILIAFSAQGAYAQGVKENRVTAPLDLKPDASNDLTAPPATLERAEEEPADKPATYQSEPEVAKKVVKTAPAAKPAIVAPVAAPVAAKAPAKSAVVQKPAAAAPTTVTVPVDASISVMPVTNISLDTLGIYDTAHGGVGFGAWDNAGFERVRSLFATLPDAVPSAAVRDLVKKLLLSTTRPPVSANIQQNVFAQRIETLIRIGEVDGAKQLLDMVPPDLLNESIVRQRFIVRLLAKDTAWVCSEIGKALSAYPADPLFWQKISLFCLANDKKAAEVQLGLDVLHEQGIELPPAFEEMTAILLGSRDTQESRLEGKVALSDAALFAVAGVDGFPKDYLQTAPLPLAKLVAADTRFADYVRDIALARLTALGASEKPSDANTLLVSWFKQQFSQEADRHVEFDRLLQEMQKKVSGAAQTEGPVMPTDRAAYRMYSLFEALDFAYVSVADPFKTPLLKLQQTEVSPMLRMELSAASEDGREGEMILLSAIVLGQVGNLKEMDDATLADVVSALVRLNHRETAQMLAAEAMVALF